MTIKEKIISGKFNYFDDAQLYTEETFSVHQEDRQNGTLTFISEVKTPLKSGEVILINVHYELTSKFDPRKVVIKRRLAAKQSEESFLINNSTKNIEYNFTSSDGSCHTQSHQFSGKPHIVTPCFATSMIMLNSKKTTSIKRTQYDLISTQNIWDYHSPLIEQSIYAQSMSIEPVEIKVGAKILKSSHYGISHESSGDIESNFYLSKRYYIPYKAIFKNNLTIEVDQLQTHESKYKNMF